MPGASNPAAVQAQVPSCRCSRRVLAACVHVALAILYLAAQAGSAADATTHAVAAAAAKPGQSP